jgi:hypothetical protein
MFQTSLPQTLPSSVAISDDEHPRIEAYCSTPEYVHLHWRRYYRDFKKHQERSLKQLKNPYNQPQLANSDRARDSTNRNWLLKRIRYEMKGKSMKRP